MKQCLGCKGLIPETIESCPNCAVTRRSLGAKALVAAAGVVVLVASSCGTPMALYGVPCTSKQVDGGMNGCIGSCDTLQADGGDPKKDPNDSCFVDGGTP